jgi:serine O-acetyltransferase
MGQKFKMDVARWVVPQQIADLSQVTFARTLKLLFWHPPLQALMWFRFASWCRGKHIPLGGLIQLLIYYVYGLEILVGADYGGGLYIAHPIGMVVAAEKIGENCSIIANVTIGMRNEWKFPILGNNVFIGAGARVLGGIVLGDDCVIGANAVVINDVPCGATVVGIPGKVVKIKGQQEGQGNHLSPN